MQNNKKQKKGQLSYKFLRSIYELEMQCKKGIHFLLMLVGIPSSLIYCPLRTREVGVFLLNEQNLLSMMEVICQWSLNRAKCLFTV